MGKLAHMEGQRITWRSVHGTSSGVIVGKERFGWKVLLENGKYVIVHPKSIIHAEAAK